MKSSQWEQTAHFSLLSLLVLITAWWSLIPTNTDQYLLINTLLLMLSLLLLISIVQQRSILNNMNCFLTALIGIEQISDHCIDCIGEAWSVSVRIDQYLSIYQYWSVSVSIDQGFKPEFVFIRFVPSRIRILMFPFLNRLEPNEIPVNNGPCRAAVWHDNMYLYLYIDQYFTR